MKFSDLWKVAGCKRPQEDVVVGHFGFWVSVMPLGGDPTGGVDVYNHVIG